MALTIMATTLVFILLLQLFYTAWERAEVRNTADLAAVSAAIELRDTDSPARGCTRAQEIAAEMSVECFAEGEIVSLVLRKQPRFAWLANMHEAKAIAGPADLAQP